MLLSKFGKSKVAQDELLSRVTSEDRSFYSLLIDESNDHGDEAKDLVVLIRFLDPTLLKECPNVDLYTQLVFFNYSIVFIFILFLLSFRAFCFNIYMAF